MYYKLFKTEHFHRRCLKFIEDDAMKLCGPSKVTCSTNAYRVANNRKNTELCNCLPACNSVTYDVSMLDGAYKLSEVFRNYRPNESKMFEK